MKPTVKNLRALAVLKYELKDSTKAALVLLTIAALFVIAGTLDCPF